MIVTVKQLREMGACVPQVKLFKKTFGESVELTRELVLDHASKFDLDWFAYHFLTREKRRAFNKMVNPALGVCLKATASAWKAFEKAINVEWETYLKVIDSAVEARNKATAPAWEAYKKSRAIALCDVLEIE
jgi:hypothetical protein